MELLTKLIYIYFVLAIGYNLLSIVITDVTGRGLGPTEPMSGVLTITMLLVIYSGTALLEPIVRISLMLVFLLLVVRFGIVRHCLAYSDELYFSRASWFSAIAINMFGVSVLSVSLFL